MMHLISTRTTDELYSRIRLKRGGGGYKDFFPNSYFAIDKNLWDIVLFLTPPPFKKSS